VLIHVIMLAPEAQQPIPRRKDSIRMKRRCVRVRHHHYYYFCYVLVASGCVL